MIHRITFMFMGQVRLDETNWSFPVQIEKEDTITLVLRKHDSTRTFVRTEIRGYEEGSRFTAVFRLGSMGGPIRCLFTFLIL